jgi:hypothetical protein
MPQLGLGLRANVSGVSLIDGDAAAYFTRAGVTSPTAKAQINAFVKGVKNLGIWSSFICWPLKSSQNAGSGTTAYSLGGFGPFNGSFVSSPTWGVDGVTFNGSNSISLSTSIATGRVHRIAMGVGKITGYNVNRFFDIQDGTSTTRRNPFLGVGCFGSFDVAYNLPNSGVSAPETAAFISNLPLNTYYSVIGRTTGGSMFVYRDKSLRATLTGQTFNQGSQYTAAGIGVSYEGTISFAALGGDDISEAQLNSLNDLYASTLGGNLDLDADSYILRAGVTDPTAKTQINDFVVGVKSLGLWNNMVCWPLRSTQNAGTGTTAYSLGGYGTYNGTLTGSASWSESGAVLPSNATITATVPYGTTSGSIIGVRQANSINGAGKDYGLLKNGTSGFWAPYGDTNFYFDYPETTNRLNISAGVTEGVIFFVAGYAGASGSKIYRNTTLLASNATVAAIMGSTTSIITSASAASQVTPFAMLLNTDASANHSNLYSLYKTTLGVGLGLP